MHRVTDLAKTVLSSKQELAILTQMSESLVHDRSHFMQGELIKNTNDIRQVVFTNISIHHTLGMIQVILCGLLGFALLDRLTGTWTVTNREWASSFIDLLLGTPYLFLCLNLSVWLVLGWQMQRINSNKSEKSSMISNVKIILNEKILAPERMKAWISSKTVMFSDATWEVDRNNTKVMWNETNHMAWGGSGPRLEVEYDDDNSYLFSIGITYKMAEGKLTPQELKEKVMAELRDWNIVDEQIEEEVEEQD
jgi:hypothetical protein